MEGRATFIIKETVAICVRFDSTPDMTREDMQDAAWSALVMFMHNNHEVVYSFAKPQQQQREQSSSDEEGKAC
jgi:hypothetical protein